MSEDTANWTAEIFLASSCTSLFLTLLSSRSGGCLPFGLHTLSGREVVLAVFLFRIIVIIIIVVVVIVVFFLGFLFTLFGGWTGFLTRSSLSGWCSSFCGSGCRWLGRCRCCDFCRGSRR